MRKRTFVAECCNIQKTQIAFLNKTKAQKKII